MQYIMLCSREAQEYQVIGIKSEWKGPTFSRLNLCIQILESIVNEHPVTIYPGRMSASPTRKVSPNNLTNPIDRPLKNGINGTDSFCMESSEDDSLQYHNLPSSVLIYNKPCPMSLGNEIIKSPTSSVFTASNNNELMYISQPNLSMDKNSDLIDGLSLYSSSPPSLYSPPLPASPVTHSEQESLTNDENLTDYHATTDDEENLFEDHERVHQFIKFTNRRYLIKYSIIHSW